MRSELSKRFKTIKDELDNTIMAINRNNHQIKMYGKELSDIDENLRTLSEEGITASIKHVRAIKQEKQKIVKKLKKLKIQRKELNEKYTELVPKYENIKAEILSVENGENVIKFPNKKAG